MLQKRQGDPRIPPGQAEQPAEHCRARLFTSEGFPRPAAVETHEIFPLLRNAFLIQAVPARFSKPGGDAVDRDTGLHGCMKKLPGRLHPLAERALFAYDDRDAPPRHSDDPGQEHRAIAYRHFMNFSAFF